MTVQVLTKIPIWFFSLLPSYVKTSVTPPVSVARRPAEPGAVPAIDRAVPRRRHRPRRHRPSMHHHPGLGKVPRKDKISECVRGKIHSTIGGFLNRKYTGTMPLATNDRSSWIKWQVTMDKKRINMRSDRAQNESTIIDQYNMASCNVATSQ
jgi:hypothetical protein